ncbi:MAG: hypothetical protein ABI378_14695 [Chitinophagaceae bacterium]
MKFTTLLSVIIVISLSACKQPNKQTKIFSDYLERTYQKEIPEAEHTYVSFPKNVGCLGCGVHTFNFLLANQFPNVTLICNESQIGQLPIKSTYEILVDSNAELEQLNLNTQNVAILETSDRQIKRIVSIQADNIDSTLNAYFLRRKKN